MPLILAPPDYVRWLGEQESPRDLMRPFTRPGLFGCGRYQSGSTSPENDQRGTSRREDALDTFSPCAARLIIPQGGCPFEVHIEKARTLAGERALPFEAAVEPFVTDVGPTAASADKGT